jgi:hypothetical protein
MESDTHPFFHVFEEPVGFPPQAWGFGLGENQRQPGLEEGGSRRPLEAETDGTDHGIVAETLGPAALTGDDALTGVGAKHGPGFGPDLGAAFLDE